MRVFLPCVMLAWTLSAQSAGDLAGYRQAVDAYRDGRAPQAEPAVSDAALSSIVSRAADPASGWTTTDLFAAAMFHTERALSLARSSADNDATAQVTFAVTLLRAALQRDPARAVFARRWRSAVAGLLHAAGARELAARIEAEALPGLTETKAQTGARAAFALGLTEEIRAAVAGPLSGTLPKRNAPIPPGARVALAAAARHFQDALAADPADAEAALHFGRIMVVTGREMEADPALRIAAAAADPPVRYLATMFLGAVAERQSRYADAERHYLTARDAFPWGQSAPLALSHVLMRQGREAEARGELARHFTRSSSRLVEPLWTYLADPATDLGPTLNLLRAEVWR